MDEINDVQALEKISSEVDDSQIKVILSTQCIKAQAYLLDKLRKQADRYKQTCSYISCANLTLEAEIKQAEQEIRSMLIAQDTIKTASVEIRKELLMAKQHRADVLERLGEGKKKYEDLWLVCKTRYESIPFVQKLLQAEAKVTSLKIDIDTQDKEILTIYEEIEKRRLQCVDVDRKRCIELANYMINVIPKAVKDIKEKEESINIISKQIEQLLNEPEIKNKEVNVAIEPPTLNVSEYLNKVSERKDGDSAFKNEEYSLIPKLNIMNFDLDFMDVNFDQVKEKKDAILNNISIKANFMDNLPTNIGNYNTENYNEGKSAYDYTISPYFKPFQEEKTTSFGNRKLITILEDVRINDKEASKIVKNVDPEKLKSVNEIEVASNEANTENNKPNPKEKANAPMESDIIEEIDITSSKTDNIIIPPTQFLDFALSDNMTKKRVSFELTPSPKINEIVEHEERANDNEVVNQSITSQLDTSAVTVASDESFMKIKDMILKKHNLDLSPQFEYAKTNVLPKGIDDTTVIKSKFFQNVDNDLDIDKRVEDKMDIEVDYAKSLDQERQVQEELVRRTTENLPMEVDEIAVSSPKHADKKETRTDTSPTEEKPERAVSGLLFDHGTQGIPDSLNVSISTTGYEDSDFPHCIDSSLLMSPKADIPNNENQDVSSQEVPNFLSGFRKTGLSFFGGPSTSAANQEGNNQDNFSFNFGGEKKARGGLFSLFR